MKAFSATITEPNEDKSLPNAQSTPAQVSVTPMEHESTRLLKENSERYQAIVDTAVDAIIVADRFGEVRSFNRAAETIFGYSAEEVIDRNIKFLMPETYQVKHDGYLAAYRDTGERKIIGIGREVVGLRKDGTTVALELSIAEWRDANGQQCFTGIMRDVTQRNLQARELLNVTEVAEQARLEAESANRAKTEFLAVMSHEIRTPLTSISGFVDLLTRTGNLTAQQSRYVDLVRSANAALLTIVNDILDFSKVEAGQLELECRAFSARALINDVIAIVLPVASAKNLRIEYTADESMPEWLMGDHARLRQVLLNLLNNAVKFTDAGSITIEARTQMLADGRERTRFSVTDTGIGIPAEQQHRLFKKFSQADSSISRRHGGTGLGLAICKRLVELMDGQIGVISNVGRGTTIWFTAYLPLTSMPAPQLASEPTPAHLDGRRPKILVVDDIDTNLEIVEAYLSDNGYSVDTVASATEAIQMLPGGNYDLILMDIQMPVMDGVTATRCIRALPNKMRDIPIIAMTGNVLPQQVKSFLDAGMNDHVGKPIERAKLYNNVRRWLPKTPAIEADVTLELPHFDKTKYEEFVRALGVERVERTARKFLQQLDDAFKSTDDVATREAHDLINCAGVLGFPGLVEACQAICQMSPDKPNSRPALIEDARTAQSTVRRILVAHVFPALQGMALRPTG